jgi:hypothetical protein
MICPYCQHEIDVDTLSCPRCHTDYPRSGKPFGFGLRTAVAGTAMLLVCSLILVDCVIDELPGGPDSSVPSGSAQLPYQPVPNAKSQEVVQQLQRWTQQQQNGSQAIPPNRR